MYTALTRKTIPRVIANLVCTFAGMAKIQRQYYPTIGDIEKDIERLSKQKKNWPKNEKLFTQKQVIAIIQL